MFPWRLARAFAIAGGIVAIVVALLATWFPLGWDTAAWRRALPVPLALLTLAAIGLRARAGPSLAGRLAWGALVGGIALVALMAIVPVPVLVLLAPYLPAVAAFVLGVVAGARRSLPRAASVALLLAPAAVLVPSTMLSSVPGAAFGLGLVFLVVGTTTID